MAETEKNSYINLTIYKIQAPFLSVKVDFGENFQIKFNKA